MQGRKPGRLQENPEIGRLHLPPQYHLAIHVAWRPRNSQSSSSDFRIGNQRMNHQIQFSHRWTPWLDPAQHTSPYLCSARKPFLPGDAWCQMQLRYSGSVEEPMATSCPTCDRPAAIACNCNRVYEWLLHHLSGSDIVSSRSAYKLQHSQPAVLPAVPHGGPSCSKYDVANVMRKSRHGRSHLLISQGSEFEVVQAQQCVQPLGPPGHAAMFRSRLKAACPFRTTNPRKPRP